MEENKTKALEAALSQIEKQFGKGSIMRLGEHDVARDIQVVSTGSLRSTGRNRPERRH
jgi:recombination protein RecA